MVDAVRWRDRARHRLPGVAALITDHNMNDSDQKDTADIAPMQELSGDELAKLAAQMCAATDPAVKTRIRDQITRGFYGTQIRTKSS